MTNVIGVRFRNVGKLYYFDPGALAVRPGDRVIVETARGAECGFVAIGSHEVEDGRIVKPLKRVVRIATPGDVAQYNANRMKEQDARRICQKKIREHGLEMKLVDVEYAFDGQKILFYFTADGRVDFRELVKDLASVFHTRIELRQIGVRDESKMLGGIGTCGRPFCCSTFLFDFQPVSIKMAKEQGKSLNPTKISGVCGRLMCCLKYEQEVYEELLRQTPKNGSTVQTPDGAGVVVESNLLMRTVKVRSADKPDAMPKSYPLDEIGWSGTRPRPQKEAQADEASPLPEGALYSHIELPAQPAKPQGQGGQRRKKEGGAQGQNQNRQKRRKEAKPAGQAAKPQQPCSAAAQEPDNKPRPEKRSRPRRHPRSKKPKAPEGAGQTPPQQAPGGN